jgi:hypothetical protein
MSRQSLSQKGIRSGDGWKEGFEKAQGEEGPQVAAHSRQQDGRGEKARCQEQARREEGRQGFEEGRKESREKVAKESCEEGR